MDCFLYNRDLCHERVKEKLALMEGLFRRSLKLKKYLRDQAKKNFH